MEFLHGLDENTMPNLVQVILLKALQNRHTKIRNVICKLFSISIKKILSFYYAIKYWYKTESGIISILDKYNYFFPAIDSKKQVEQSNDKDDYARKKNKVKHRYFSRIAGSSKNI